MNTLFNRLIIVGTALVLTACAGIEAPKHNVLPLDHGPRAQATPWQNQQRLLRAEQQAKAASLESSRKPNE